MDVPQIQLFYPKCRDPIIERLSNRLRNAGADLGSMLPFSVSVSQEPYIVGKRLFLSFPNAGVKKLMCVIINCTWYFCQKEAFIENVNCKLLWIKSIRFFKVRPYLGLLELVRIYAVRIPPARLKKCSWTSLHTVFSWYVLGLLVSKEFLENKRMMVSTIPNIKPRKTYFFRVLGSMEKTWSCKIHDSLFDPSNLNHVSQKPRLLYYVYLIKNRSLKKSGFPPNRL